jgi:hypothetical protein
MSRADIEKSVRRAIADIIRAKGHVTMLDVLLFTGRVEEHDHLAWRNGQVPYLEKVIHGNLSKASVMLREFHRVCREAGYKPSWTAYRKWGKGAKRPLQFSKSRQPELERLYATAYVRTQSVGRG